MSLAAQRLTLLTQADLRVLWKKICCSEFPKERDVAIASLALRLDQDTDPKEPHPLARMRVAYAIEKRWTEAEVAWALDADGRPQPVEDGEPMCTVLPVLARALRRGARYVLGERGLPVPAR